MSIDTLNNTILYLIFGVLQDSDDYFLDLNFRQIQGLSIPSKEFDFNPSAPDPLFTEPFLGPLMILTNELHVESPFNHRGSIPSSLLHMDLCPGTHSLTSDGLLLPT